MEKILADYERGNLTVVELFENLLAELRKSGHKFYDKVIPNTRVKKPRDLDYIELQRHEGPNMERVVINYFPSRVSIRVELMRARPWSQHWN